MDSKRIERQRSERYRGRERKFLLREKAKGEEHSDTNIREQCNYL
jgi:hypothetical protein